MEDNKGCLKAIVAILIVVIMGDLLFKGIIQLGNYPAIIIMATLGAVFVGFIIMCIRGMKKEKGED